MWIRIENTALHWHIISIEFNSIILEVNLTCNRQIYVCFEGDLNWQLTEAVKHIME